VSNVDPALVIAHTRVRECERGIVHTHNCPAAFELEPGVEATDNRRGNVVDNRLGPAA
jgi:hypothetical protein